jgi:hypothetical protein
MPPRPILSKGRVPHRNLLSIWGMMQSGWTSVFDVTAALSISARAGQDNLRHLFGQGRRPTTTQPKTGRL